MTYGYFEGCGNCMFNLLRSFSSSLRDIVQASLALCPLRSSVLQNYVVNNLVMCENRVNTHTHTHTVSSRVFYKIYLEYQRVSRTFFYGFSAQPINYMFSQWCSALHVAVQEALYHITALPVGTHRALLETPYFF